MRVADDLTIAEAMLEAMTEAGRFEPAAVDVTLDAAERELAGIQPEHPERDALARRLAGLRREVSYRRMKSSDIVLTGKVG